VLGYLRGLALRVAGDPSAMLLLATSIVGLVFAFLNPPVTVSVLFLYWVECAAIGAVNVAKLRYVRKPRGLSDAGTADLPPVKRFAYRSIVPGIFVIHYGIFLIIVFALLYLLGEHEMRVRGEGHYDVWGHLAGFWLPALVIGSGHIASFVRNFLGKREYIGRKVVDQMFRPYKRTMILLLVVVGGSGLIALFSLSDMVLLAVVPLAIIASLEAHFRERTS
jgi:hypothetical protein